MAKMPRWIVTPKSKEWKRKSKRERPWQSGYIHIQFIVEKKQRTPQHSTRTHILLMAVRRRSENKWLYFYSPNGSQRYSKSTQINFEKMITFEVSCYIRRNGDGNDDESVFLDGVLLMCVCMNCCSSVGVCPSIDITLTHLYIMVAIRSMSVLSCFKSIPSNPKKYINMSSKL